MLNVELLDGDDTEVPVGALRGEYSGATGLDG